mmetsp:Transcript_155015/g.496872  ORF Transcript_155015/g.496872 Transcript_155015/m.496872 type:complete len:408 (+) Transcript_155015:158-1381(+)
MGRLLDVQRVRVVHVNLWRIAASGERGRRRPHVRRRYRHWPRCGGIAGGSGVEGPSVRLRWRPQLLRQRPAAATGHAGWRPRCAGARRRHRCRIAGAHRRICGEGLAGGPGEASELRKRLALRHLRRRHGEHGLHRHRPHVGRHHALPWHGRHERHRWRRLLISMPLLLLFELREHLFRLSDEGAELLRVVAQLLEMRHQLLGLMHQALEVVHKGPLGARRRLRRAVRHHAGARVGRHAVSERRRHARPEGRRRPTRATGAKRRWRPAWAERHARTTGHVRPTRKGHGLEHRWRPTARTTPRRHKVPRCKCRATTRERRRHHRGRRRHATHRRRRPQHRRRRRQRRRSGAAERRRRPGWGPVQHRRLELFSGVAAAHQAPCRHHLLSGDPPLTGDPLLKGKTRGTHA